MPGQNPKLEKDRTERVMIKERYGWRARIGIITPGLGITQTREWGSLMPEGISFHTTLMELVETTPETLPQLKARAIFEAKKLTLTGLIDILLFSCTSGSFVGGPGYDQEIIKELEKATGVPSTTTSTCVLAAFADLGVKNIAMVGPYIKDVFDIEIQFFKHHGIETIYCKGMGYEKVEHIIKISEQPYIYYRLVKEAHRMAPDADVIFITCMASPIAKVVNTLEQETEKPVVSSCSASLYGVLKQLGIKDPVENYGQLLEISR